MESLKGEDHRRRFVNSVLKTEFKLVCGAGSIGKGGIAGTKAQRQEEACCGEESLKYVKVNLHSCSTEDIRMTTR
jgi:hypothetical protein